MADVQEKLLEKHLEKIAKENNYENYKIKTTPVSSEGANYTSRLFLTTISAPNQPDLNLFSKIAAVGDKFRSQMSVQIFDVENYAYGTLSKIFDRIQDKYRVPVEHRYRMPKIYAFDDTYLEEVLVLQNLTADGFTMHDRLKSMDWEYAARTLEELAKFHTLSIIFQEDYPEEFERATKILRLQTSADRTRMVDAMTSAAKKTIDTVTDEGHKEKLRKFMEEQGGGDVMQRFMSPMKRPVLAHGDFRMSNIMHKIVKDKLEVVFVDYQCVHLGCGIRDMLYFLVCGTDEEFREKHFFPLLEHYYDHMGAMLNRFGRDLVKVYPRKDFDYEVKMNLPFGLLVAMLVMPVVTVASEDAPEMGDDFGIDKVAAIKTGSLYETRMNGLVRDCVKWGVI